MKYIRKTETVKTVVVYLYGKDKIRLDLSFQRKGCWTLSTKQEYIQCLLHSYHPGFWVYAQTNQDLDDNEVSFDSYFSELKDDYEYVSIDANNRTVALHEFINNEFPVTDPHDGEEKYFRDLTDDNQEKFLNIKLEMIVYTKCTRKDCSDIFLNLNSQTDVSKQEKRNARGGAIAAAMRGYEPGGVPFFSDDNIGRDNDQFILQMLHILHDNNLTPSDKHIDVTWDLPSETLVPLFERTKEIFGFLIDFFAKHPVGTRHAKAITADVFTAISLLTSNGAKYSVGNLKKLIYGLALEHINQYNSEEKIEFNGDLTLFSKQMKGVTLGAKPWSERKRIILEKLLAHVLRDGDILPYTKREINTADPEVRREVAKLQGWECKDYETGEIIKIVNEWDTQRWEIDHIIPVSLGGPDHYMNMRLILKRDNRRKGNRAA